MKQLSLLTLNPEAADLGATLTRHLAPFFGDDLIVEVRCPKIDDHEIAAGKVSKLVELKGMPKSVVKLVFNMLDLPPDEEAMDDLANFKDEPAAPPGAPGAVPGAPAELAEGSLGPREEVMGVKPDGSPEEPNEMDKPDAERDEPLEVTTTRPGPDELGEGSLGPRKPLRKAFEKRMKSLAAAPKKSLYNLVRRACANGS